MLKLRRVPKVSTNALLAVCAVYTTIFTWIMPQPVRWTYPPLEDVQTWIHVSVEMWRPQFTRAFLPPRNHQISTGIGGIIAHHCRLEIHVSSHHTRYLHEKLTRQISSWRKSSEHFFPNQRTEFTGFWMVFILFILSKKVSTGIWNMSLTHYHRHIF